MKPKQGPKNKLPFCFSRGGGVIDLSTQGISTGLPSAEMHIFPQIAEKNGWVSGETQNSGQVLLQGAVVEGAAAGRDSELRLGVAQGAVAGCCRRVLQQAETQSCAGCCLQGAVAGAAAGRDSDIHRVMLQGAAAGAAAGGAAAGRDSELRRVLLQGAVGGAAAGRDSELRSCHKAETQSWAGCCRGLPVRRRQVRRCSLLGALSSSYHLALPERRHVKQSRQTIGSGRRRAIHVNVAV